MATVLLSASNAVSLRLAPAATESAQQHQQQMQKQEEWSQPTTRMMVSVGLPLWRPQRRNPRSNRETIAAVEMMAIATAKATAVGRLSPSDRAIATAATAAPKDWSNRISQDCQAKDELFCLHGLAKGARLTYVLQHSSLPTYWPPRTRSSRTLLLLHPSAGPIPLLLVHLLAVGARLLAAAVTVKGLLRR